MSKEMYPRDDYNFTPLASNKDTTAYHIYYIDKSRNAIDIYAVSDDKKTVKLFKKQRDMSKFIIKKIEYDTYEDKLLDMGQFPGDILTISEFESINYDDKKPDHTFIEIAATRSEYDYSVSFEGILAAMSDSLASVPYNMHVALKDKYLECLYTLYFPELLDLFTDTDYYDKSHTMNNDAFEEIARRHFDSKKHKVDSDYSVGANLEFMHANALENFLANYKDTLSL